MKNMQADQVVGEGVLSQAELEFFDREGYLVVENVFKDEDQRPVINELTQHLDQLAREAVAAGKLSRTFEELGFEHRLASINKETREIARTMWNGSVVLPAFFDLMRTTRLLDVVEQLCGPEIIASSVYRLRPKVPEHVMSAVPWHQDSGYFEPYCDKKLILTVWLPLVNATKENGCMWVLPRRHKGEVLFHQQAQGQPYLEIPESVLAREGAVCCPVKKGGVLLMSNRTPHASYGNSTDRVRWSMDLRYQSAALPTNAKITRLPGESTEAAVDLEDGNAPVACYPPEPDFLVRSKLRPAEVMTTKEEFLRLRREHLKGPLTNRWNAHWESDGTSEAAKIGAEK